MSSDVNECPVILVVNLSITFIIIKSNNRVFTRKTNLDGNLQLTFCY